MSVYELSGYLDESKDTLSGAEGIKSFVLRSTDPALTSSSSTDPALTSSSSSSSLLSAAKEKEKDAAGALMSSTSGVLAMIPESESQYNSVDSLLLHGDDHNLGTVAMSLGEVSFVELKTKIERKGITVDSIRVREGYLLCDSQVAIKWEKDGNGFIIEGPPSKLYDTIRSIVYEKFAFV